MADRRRRRRPRQRSSRESVGHGCRHRILRQRRTRSGARAFVPRSSRRCSSRRDSSSCGPGSRRWNATTPAATAATARRPPRFGRARRDVRASPVASGEGRRDALAPAVARDGSGRAWAIAGLALLHLTRRGVAPAIGTGLALAAWAGGGVGRSRPLAAGDSLTPVFARELRGCRHAGVVRRGDARGVDPRVRARPCPSTALPRRAVGTGDGDSATRDFVAATGIGWLLLLDLSANGPPGQPLPRALSPRPPVARDARVHAWSRSCGGRSAARSRGRCRSSTGCREPRRGALGALAAGAIVARAGRRSYVGGRRRARQLRQFTSELGRLWLIVGAAWFFFLRGTPLTERLARSGDLARARSCATLRRWRFVVAVLVARDGR